MMILSSRKKKTGVDRRVCIFAPTVVNRQTFPGAELTLPVVLRSRKLSIFGRTYKIKKVLLGDDIKLKIARLSAVKKVFLVVSVDMSCSSNG